MPIANRFDHERKIVFSICSGIMTLEDFFAYQKRVWGSSRYFGYNELFNTVEGDWSTFNFGYLFEVARKAARLTTIDFNSKLAWVILEGKQQELTAFYKTAKSLLPVQSRAMEAFYSEDQALKWLTE